MKLGVLQLNLLTSAYCAAVVAVLPASFRSGWPHCEVDQIMNVEKLASSDGILVSTSLGLTSSIILSSGDSSATQGLFKVFKHLWYHCTLRAVLFVC